MAHLIQTVKVVLHTLDGDIFAIFDALSLEHLRKGAFALFADQPVPESEEGRTGGL